jgi:hypothetical protein
VAFFIWIVSLDFYLCPRSMLRKAAGFEFSFVRLLFSIFPKLFPLEGVEGLITIF